MNLDHTEDGMTQMQRLTEATNENIKLTEELVAIGTALNLAKLDVMRATTEEEMRERKIIWQEIYGKMAEKKARIRCQKEIMSSIKYLIKAEGSKF